MQVNTYVEAQDASLVYSKHPSNLIKLTQGAEVRCTHTPFHPVYAHTGRRKKVHYKCPSILFMRTQGVGKGGHSNTLPPNQAYIQSNREAHSNALLSCLCPHSGYVLHGPSLPHPPPPAPPLPRPPETPVLLPFSNQCPTPVNFLLPWCLPPPTISVRLCHRSPPQTIQV
jgi:hypothetical protein